MKTFVRIAMVICCAGFIGCASGRINLQVPVPDKNINYIKLAEIKAERGDYGGAFAAYLEAQQAKPSLLEDSAFRKKRDAMASRWYLTTEQIEKNGGE